MSPESPSSRSSPDQRIIEAGPLFRPYAVTRGRVEPATEQLDLVAQVIANPGARCGSLVLQPEHRTILAMAHNPISIAEVAAGLNLALGIVRVLIGDLLEHNMISVSKPPSPHAPSSEPVLRKVLHGLRNL